MSNLNTYVESNAKIHDEESSVERVVIGLSGTPTELIVYQGKIYVYDSEGQTTIDGGYISSTEISSDSITTDKLSIGGKKIAYNIVWTVTNENTCIWSSGIINFSDGTSININAGSTGDITDTTFIYYNGSNNLAKTNYYEIAAGYNSIPLVIVEKSESNGKCVIKPFKGIGTTIDGDLITTGKIESFDSKTYFDLENNRIQISDDDNTRVVIGKMSDGSYGIKVSLAGYTADTESDIYRYSLWATSGDTADNILIKECMRGVITVPGQGVTTIEHDLGYIPDFLVYSENPYVSGKKMLVSGFPFLASSVRAAADIKNLYLIQDATAMDGQLDMEYFIFYEDIE